MAPRCSGKGRRPEGGAQVFWRGQAPRGWRPAFLATVACDLFNINDDDDDANARSNLAMRYELRNQRKPTMLE